MIPEQAMTAIEERRFAALVNLASSVKTFLRIAGQQPEVEALSLAMTNDPAVVSAVFQWATALSAMRGDGAHEHEADAALAAYLWLLSKHRHNLAEAAAGTLHERRHFFWARKLADEIHAANGRANGNNGREPDGAATKETRDEKGLLR